MKGLTHFISGIAAASFIPQAVQRSAAVRSDVEGAASSFILALAGLYAIMPDTLDFKIGRYLEKADVDIAPDPRNPNPQAMADAMGRAMDRAWDENREVRVQFRVLQLSADRWQRYFIKFNTDEQSVSVIWSDIVTMSQVPFPGTAPENNTGVYHLKSARLLPGSTRDTTVDIMSGPMYGFRKQGEYLMADFLPWHRTWSHSYTLGAFLAILLWPLALWTGWEAPWLYPLVAFLGFATHITEDLTGHMGGSLIWPFIKTRTRGLAWFHAADPDPNFVTDYLAVVIIIFNIDRYTTHLIPLSAPFYFLIFFVGVMVLYFLPRQFVRKSTVKSAPPAVPAGASQTAVREKKAMEEIESESESIG